MDELEFGQLTRDEQLSLFESWLDTGEIQVLGTNGEWFTVQLPNWKSDNIYRQVPAKPDVVCWDLIDERFNWYARNVDGSVLIANICPEALPAHGRWERSEVDMEYTIWIPQGALHITEQGSLPWHLSLQQRPTNGS